MVTRSAIVGIVVVLGALTACGSRSAVPCQDPPDGQPESPAGVQLVLQPNPVAPGSDARLSISADDLPANAIVGAGVTWQCWDGTAWVDTHHMVRGRYGGYRTQAMEPGMTVTIPAVGLPVPNTYHVLVPEVRPGRYRIVDTVWVDGAEEVTVWVIVQVT